MNPLNLYSFEYLLQETPSFVTGDASGTAQAVLDFAKPNARLIFSCGWHISKDGKDVYSWFFKVMVKAFGWIGRLTRFVDLNDQVEATRQ